MLEMDLALVDLLRGAWPDQWRASDTELLWTRLAASAEFRRAIELRLNLRGEAEAVLAHHQRTWPGPARHVPAQSKKKIMAAVAVGLLILFGLFWLSADRSEEQVAKSPNEAATATAQSSPDEKKSEQIASQASVLPAVKSTSQKDASRQAVETDTESVGEAAEDPAEEKTAREDKPEAKQANQVADQMEVQPADLVQQAEQPAEEEAQAAAKAPEEDEFAGLTGREKRLAKVRKWKEDLKENPREHPLALEPSREAQTFWLELTASLSGQHWKDLHRTLESVSPELLGSLVADFKDESLWVSYATLMETLLESEPRLRALIQQEMEPLARLRLAAAVEAQNARQVASVAWHFYGTEASSQALLWMADRAISTGDFATARTYYEQAKRYADATTREMLDVRLRLAGAMLGTPLGKPVTKQVEIAGEEFTPVNFEAMVLTQELTHDRRYVSPDLVGAELQAVFAPAPKTNKGQEQTFSTTTWVDIKDQASDRRGDNPPDERSLPADELFSMPVGDLTLLGNTYFVSAVDTRTGKKRWKKELTSEQERHGLRAIGPVKPAVADGQVYVRRWTREGTELLCLNLAAGDVLWQAELTPDERHRNLRGIMLTDPQVRGSSVTLFTATPADDSFARRGIEVNEIIWEIRLAEFSRRNGKLLSEKSLVRLTGLVYVPRGSRVANVGRWRVMQVAGTVIAVDASGELAWVRKVPWKEPEEYDPAYRCAAVSTEEMVCVWQPGASTVECLEVSTGHRLWHAPASPITQLVGCQQGRLIAVTQTGLQGYDLTDGRPVWSKELPYSARQAVLCGSPGGLLYADAEPTPDGSWEARLHWVDAATGETTHSTALRGELPTGKSQVKPLITPLISHGTGMLAGFDTGTKRQLTRQLLWIAPEE